MRSLFGTSPARAAAPPPLAPRKAAALARIERLATLFDAKFSIFGIRFGLDALIGIFPLLGDIIAGAFSAYLILEAIGAGARGITILRMILNVLIDTVFGSVPIAGGVFDVFYRANLRNVRLLRADLTGVPA